MTNIFSLYLLGTNFTHLWYPIKEETFTNELEDMLEDSLKLERETDMGLDNFRITQQLQALFNPFNSNFFLPEVCE